MIILLPLLRKLSIRSRLILGRGLLALGVVALLVGVAALPGIVVLSAVTAAVGAVFLLSGWSSARAAGRRARGSAARA